MSSTLARVPDVTDPVETNSAKTSHTAIADLTILDGWSDDHTRRFRTEPLTFRHRLEESGLFTDAALIDLLDRHPAHLLDVCTMGGSDHPLYPNRFRTGDFRDASSEDLLAAAKAGCLWINVRNALNEHDDYNALLRTMYGELATQTGNRAFKPKGGVLISSPIARVPYHFDKTEVVLWHVRGQKTVHVWPVTQDFIPDTAHEAKLMQSCDDDLPYRADFEDHATVLALQPGDGAAWPLNAPHRVDNKTFCVSVTTEYSTPESLMKNSTMTTNALLRRYLNRAPLYADETAMSRQIKSVAGHVLRKAAIGRAAQEPDMVSFRIDADVDDYIVDVEPFERCF